MENKLVINGKEHVLTQEQLNMIRSTIYNEFQNTYDALYQDDIIEGVYGMDEVEFDQYRGKLKDILNLFK